MRAYLLSAFFKEELANSYQLGFDDGFKAGYEHAKKYLVNKTKPPAKTATKTVVAKKTPVKKTAKSK